MLSVREPDKTRTWDLGKKERSMMVFVVVDLFVPKPEVRSVSQGVKSIGLESEPPYS